MRRFIKRVCCFIEKMWFQKARQLQKIHKNKKIVQVKEGNKIARVSPFDQTMITCNVEYDHRCIGKQSISLMLTSELYESQIVRLELLVFSKMLKNLEKWSSSRWKLRKRNCTGRRQSYQ